MNTSMFLIILSIALGVLAIITIIAYFSSKQKISLVLSQKILLEKEKQSLTEQYAGQQQLLEKERQAKTEMEKNYAILESNHNNLQTQYHNFKSDQDKSKIQFENLANRILEEKSNQFDMQQRKGLSDLLSPLKEKIKSFEDKVDQTSKESIKGYASLKEQIMGLTHLNEKMTTEAHNLTRALKGDNKQQGNWGEIVLERILEKSGLTKGQEYFVQQSMYNDENKRLQPDVIIKTPDEKVYIVDSKVSIKAYEQFVNEDDTDVSKRYLKAHADSVKRHIDNLTVKKYHDLYKTESPDFVLMFIPIDTAFSTALQQRPDLYQYAFDKNIIIVTASTLLATLKTVESLWRSDKQQQLTLEIATEAGKMYDKFVGFVTDLENIGKKLDGAKTEYDKSIGKLKNGSGNLIGKAEKLRLLGAKTNKQLPERLLVEA